MTSLDQEKIANGGECECSCPKNNVDKKLGLWALLALLISQLVVPVIVGIIGGIIGGIICGMIGAPKSTVIAIVVPLAVVLGGIVGIGVMLLAARRLSASWQGAFSLLKLDVFPRRGAWRALWLTPLLVVVGTLITVLWQWCGAPWGVKLDFSEQLSQMFASGSLSTRILVSCMAILIAPLIEEMIFRRGFFGALSRWMAPWLAAVLTALGFAAFHVSLLGLPAFWVIGMVLQYVLRKDDSLWSAIAIHAFYNLIVVIGWWTGLGQVIARLFG